MLNGKDIARLKRKPEFEQVLTIDEKRAWFCIKETIDGVLSRRQGFRSTYVDIMMRCFEKLHVHMSLKIHYLHCHLDDIEKQLASETDEHGERFHQVAAVMELRYKNKKLDALLGDLCWWIDKSFEHDDIEDEDVNVSDIEEIVENVSDEEDDDEEDAIDAEQNVPVGANFREGRVGNVEANAPTEELTPQSLSKRRRTMH